jgi:hypothetical protein
LSGTGRFSLGNGVVAMREIEERLSFPGADSFASNMIDSSFLADPFEPGSSLSVRQTLLLTATFRHLSMVDKYLIR